MAIATYFRALRIWETTRGPYFPGTLNVVGNIARAYAGIGDIVNAIVYQRRADAIVETQLALNLAAGSERQKLAFVKGLSNRTDRTISLSLNEAAGVGSHRARRPHPAAAERARAGRHDRYLAALRQGSWTRQTARAR
jgi:hypothetical protein